VSPCPCRYVSSLLISCPYSAEAVTLALVGGEVWAENEMLTLSMYMGF
jgi:hypothetical protein